LSGSDLLNGPALPHCHKFMFIEGNFLCTSGTQHCPCDSQWHYRCLID